MTKQEIIDTINKKFKGKADGIHGCVYLNNKGKKCVIGIFIPDGHPGQQEEDLGVLGLLEKYPELIREMPSDNFELLEKFQSVHDTLDDTLSIGSQKGILIQFVNRNFKE